MDDRYLIEFAKCRADPIYFMETYCRVAHPTKGLVPFKLYDFQKRVVKDFLNNRFVIVNKSRQVGLSTVTSNYALWLALFFKNRTIKIISIKDNDAKDFLKKIKTSYSGLPEWLRDEPVVSNVHTLELTSGSVIESVASGSSAARGTSPSLLIIDEFAFIPRIEEIWTSAYPALAQGGSAILISTPNGIASLFYQLWSKADPTLPEEERNNFHRIFVHWTEVPEYRGFELEEGMSREEIIRRAREQQWYRMMRPQFTDRRWAQEFEGDFLGSGNTVIKGEQLKLLVHRTREPDLRYSLRQRGENDYELVVDDEGPLWVWEKPREDGLYLVSADVASGVAEDYSAFYVFDLATGRPVAEFKGKLNTIRYAHLLARVGQWYNSAMIVPEVTGLGFGTLQKLIYEIGYTNIFRRVDPQKPKQNKKDLWGWQTTSKTKPFLINAIIEYFDDVDKVEYISQRLWEELAAFVWKTSDDAAAEQGHNDDLVMAFAIGLYAMKLYKMRSPLPEVMLLNSPETKATKLPPAILSTRVDDVTEEIREWLYGAWQDK